MVTPFDADGRLDLDAARTLARWLQDNGNDGLVVAGTTGEAPVLTDDERLSLFAAVAEAVTIPVVFGTGTNDTQPLGAPHEAGGRARRGRRAGGVPVLQPAQPGRHRGPRPGDAAATDLPVMIYDIPVRTGRKIATATLLRLFREVPNALGPEGRRRQPGRDGGGLVVDAAVARGLLGRRRSDPAVAGGGRRRHGRRGHALDRPGPPGAVRAVGEGRRRRRPPGERPHARELRLRDRRRRPEPVADQGDDAPPRPAGRSGPPAHGRRARLAAGSGRRGVGPPPGLACRPGPSRPA